MEPMSRTERTALCNTALETGQDAATLCAGWSVKDLVIHLLVRERRPLGATGIVVPRLEGLTDRSSRRLGDRDFAGLVEQVRSGPPRWSPTALPPLDRAVNTLEFFVHHEDIRRARPGWAARELTVREQRSLWRSLTVAGRGLVRSSAVPVSVRWQDGERERTATLRPGGTPVVVTGSPAELALLLFGRSQHRGLTFDGPADAVAALSGADLGL